MATMLALQKLLQHVVAQCVDSVSHDVGDILMQWRSQYVANKVRERVEDLLAAPSLDTMSNVVRLLTGGHAEALPSEVLDLVKDAMPKVLMWLCGQCYEFVWHEHAGILLGHMARSEDDTQWS